MCPARNWTVQMSLFILICDRRERNYQQCTINMTGRRHSETEIRSAYIVFGVEANANEGFGEAGRGEEALGGWVALRRDL
jgi:hypothetical protein